MFISNTDDEEINFYKMVSKNVKKYRNERNLSQLELALTIGQKGNVFLTMHKTTQKISILI